MSTEGAPSLVARAGFDDLRSLRILRLGVGIPLAAGVSLAIGWPAAFLTPVLATSLLASGAPCPPIRTGVGLVAIILAAAAFGLAVVAPLAIYYPMICAIAIGLFLFLIFRAGYGGASPFLVLWLLIAVLLLPMIAQQSLAAAQQLAGALVLGGAAAVAFTWIAHILVPDPPGVAAPGASKAGPGDAPRRDLRAAITTCVVLPVALLFYAFGLVNDLVILVFVAVLAQQPSLQEGRKASGAVLLGNLGGGVAAIAFYRLLVGAPTLGFFVALTALTTLLLGSLVFSERPEAPIYATVLSTVLLLVGGSIAPLGEDVSAKFTTRIGQIGVAAIYVVGAFALVERILAERAAAADSGSRERAPRL